MKKYIGAVVRWSFQLVIGAEQDPFENKSPVPENVHLPGTLKKTKLYSQRDRYAQIVLGASGGPGKVRDHPKKWKLLRVCLCTTSHKSKI